MPRMDEKKLHTREFQLKGSIGNMRCKLLQKRFTGKTTECSKHLRHIAIEKDILSELNRCIFQISLKYIKLVIPKILFILVLCSFNFYFKITWPPPQKITLPYQNKNFWPTTQQRHFWIFNRHPQVGGGGARPGRQMLVLSFLSGNNFLLIKVKNYAM